MFGEFSLTFTAAVSAVAQLSLSGRSAVAQRSLSGRSAVAQRSLSGRSAVAQRSLSGRCVYKESGSPSWTLDQPDTVTVGSGPRTLAGPR